MPAAVIEKPKVVEQKPRPGIELPAPHRFTEADLQTHGGWILKRLCKAMPNILENNIAGWLHANVVSNEHMFLAQDHSVGLAQVLRTSGLEGKPIVRERFVFAMEGYADEAAYFYPMFKQWAVSLSADVMIVEELTDVPHEMIREILDNRLFTRQETFVKL